MIEPPDDQTPESLCKAIIARMQWSPGERVLEPAKGVGNFYNNLPDCVVKDWCEISEGRDFFRWRKPVDTIITNPPYCSSYLCKGGNNGKNLATPFLEHAMGVTIKRIVFLLNRNKFLRLEPDRLERYARWGWGITDIAVCNVKKWIGPYYLLTFMRGGQSIIKSDATVYD